ncbi:MAG TPA: zinc ribbon domain-containing protein, partial [Bacillota bacterium]|nr:zinc ribbon domain-containing protein [Bacillota bacterium]
MYCRMCGNKISDTDQYCQMCGTPTGLENQSAAPSETMEEKEEIVFNPPFENLKFYFAEKDLRYAEEESSETEEDAASPEKEEADLKEFISENEIKEANQRKAENDRREGAGEAKPVKAPEFSWNVHDFPRPGRKT